MSTQNEQSSNWDANGFNIYADSTYHYEDAELLAKLWNIPITEAKQAIGHKITHQIEDLLPEEVQASHQAHLNEGDDHAITAIEERQAISVNYPPLKERA